MSNISKLTKKQRKFVNEYADTGNGTESALRAYDTEDRDVAASIANENLRKPEIVEALKGLGFDSDNAKRVIGEILNNEGEEARDRLKAAELTLKVGGDFAPEKTVNVNVDIESPQMLELAKQLDEQRNAKRSS